MIGAAADGGVVLIRRGAGPSSVLELRANGVFVMDTTHTDTEIALATSALAAVRRAERVLVGGLGLGHTLDAVLADPRVQQVVVAEIEPALVGWFRDGTVPLGPLLTDPRVQVVVDDVAEVVAGSDAAAYDVVLLDVDNGPGYLVHESNAALYRRAFLTRCREALAPGGVLVVWSAAAAPDLLAALRETFAGADEHPLAVRLGQRDEEYLLYLAHRDAISTEPGA